MNQHIIKEGDLLLLTDQAGNIIKNDDMQYGLYLKDTRFLSRYELLVDNIKPFILSSMEVEDRIKKIYLTNANSKKIGSKEVLIIREQIIFNGMVYDRILVKNFFSHPIALRLILKVDADYLDIFQVRNYVKEKRLGSILNPSKIKNGIVLGYLGKDGLRRETTVKILNEEGEIYKDRIELSFQLKHKQEKEVTVGIIPMIEGQKLINKNMISFERAQKKLRSNYKKWEEDSLMVKTDNKKFNQLVNRSLSDLKL